MSTRAVSKNNVVAGLFVLVCMVLAIAISVIVSGAQERLIPHRAVTFIFSIADGASGIKPGSEVQVGGQKVGRVTEVSIDPAQRVPSAPAPGAVTVKASIRSSVPLNDDALVLLERPLLGSMSIINIPDVGKSGRAVAEGGELVGRIAPPSFLAQAGYGPEQSRQVQTIIAEAERLAKRFNDLADRVDASLTPGLKDFEKFADDAAAMSGDVRARLPQWSDDAGATLKNARDLSDRFGPMADQVDSGLKDARGVVASVQDAIDDNRPRVDSIVASVDASATHIEKESLPKVDETLASVSAGAKDFGAAASTAGRLVTEEAPTFRKIIANLRLASDQAKLAIVEIKTHPWMLFYSPKAKELESENLVSAARSFAEAASDLRAASESLESAAGSDGSPLALDRESIRGMSERIQEAFRRYQEAEKDLLKRLGSDGG